MTAPPYDFEPLSDEELDAVITALQHGRPLVLARQSVTPETAQCMARELRDVRALVVEVEQANSAIRDASGNLMYPAVVRWDAAMTTLRAYALKHLRRVAHITTATQAKTGGES